MGGLGQPFLTILLKFPRENSSTKFKLVPRLKSRSLSKRQRRKQKQMKKKQQKRPKRTKGRVEWRREHVLTRRRPRMQ